MAVPTIYTEQQLATFMNDTLGDLGADLGFDPLGVGPYQEPINDALLAYGADTIATITGSANIAKLRALARVAAWRMAVTAAAARYDMSDGTQSLKRSQMFAQAKDALALAIEDAIALGGGDMAVGLDSIDYVNDPYMGVPFALRV